MKGVKTEVKTDWKNYIFKDSRGPFRIDKDTIWFGNFNQGDMIFMSYHVKWKGVDWGRWTDTYCFQACNVLGYAPVGFLNGGAESGETDVVIRPWKVKTTKETSCFIYCHTREGTIKVASDGYIEITNIMIGKGDRVQPYIDSDKAKAMGGAINKARIVTLVLSEERRVA